jgi:hypothetical protein
MRCGVAGCTVLPFMVNALDRLDVGSTEISTLAELIGTVTV